MGLKGGYREKQKACIIDIVALCARRSRAVRAGRLTASSHQLLSAAAIANPVYIASIILILRFSLDLFIRFHVKLLHEIQSFAFHGSAGYLAIELDASISLKCRHECPLQILIFIAESQEEFLADGDVHALDTAPLDGTGELRSLRGMANEEVLDDLLVICIQVRLRAEE